MRERKRTGFYAMPLDIRRPGRAAFLYRMINEVQRSGKYIRRCPDLCDAGLIEAMY